VFSRLPANIICYYTGKVGLRILTQKQGLETHEDVFSVCKGGF
jgi:hypothetical protein